MSIRLKQSTASQKIPLGIFVDETDGKTAETGLTIANTDIKLWKAGATALASKNSGGATHISGGVYYAVLDATDTDTLGPMMIFVHVAGALPIRVECAVVAADTYDLEFGADGPKKLGVIAFGTAQGATGTTLQLSAGSAFADDELNYAVIVITGGTGANQSRLITDYVGSTDTATVDTWTTTPSSDSTYVVLAAPPASATALPDVNVKQISGDATAADNLESACDGTGYAIGGATAVDAILDDVIEGSYTLRQLVRGFASALLSLVSGAGTSTVIFRDIGNTKNRIVATVDEDGNRTAITLTLT